MLVCHSASITHNGIKCPSHGCDRFITMHDIKRLTANSYGPNKLTIAECNKIDIFIQDAQLIHGIPVDKIVFCSVSSILIIDPTYVLIGRVLTLLDCVYNTANRFCTYTIMIPQAPKCGRPNILNIPLNSGQQGPIALQK
jgi:hypothetical protein